MIQQGFFINNNEEYIEEGLFSKNPYKEIIKQYRKEYVKDKSSYNNIYEKILSAFKSSLKSIKGIELYSDKNDDDWDDNDNYIVIKIPYDQNILKQTQTKIKQFRMPNSFYSDEKYLLIANINDNIVSIKDAFVWDDEMAEKYVNQIDLGVIYSKGQSNQTNISVNTVYDILSKTNGRLEQVRKGYVSIKTELSEDKCESILKSVKYDTWYNKGTIYIFSPKVKINESYNEGFIDENNQLISIYQKGEYNTMSINVLADLARRNGLENALTEHAIVENFNEKIESLTHVNEETIYADLSVIPVHRVSEAFNLDICDETILTEAGKIEEFKQKLRNKSIEKLEKEIKSFDEGLVKYKKELKELKSKKDEKSEKRVKKLEKEIADLKEARKGLVYALNEKKAKAKKVANESYAIELESLLEVASVEEISLEEAMNMIKENNQITEEDSVYCTLPEDINEQVTVEEFCEIMETLSENNIDVAWDTELVCEEFITEAGKISQVMAKVKEKIKNQSIAKLEKAISDCEENNKRLKAEIDKVKKMPKEEAEKYVKKESAKNVAIVSAYIAGAGAAGGASGYLIVFRPFLGLASYFGVLKGIEVTAKFLNKKDVPTKIGFTVEKYVQSINNTIKLNNRSIEDCKEAIKAKK